MQLKTPQSSGGNCECDIRGYIKIQSTQKFKISEIAILALCRIFVIQIIIGCLQLFILQGLDAPSYLRHCAGYTVIVHIYIAKTDPC